MYFELCKLNNVRFVCTTIFALLKTLKKERCTCLTKTQAAIKFPLLLADAFLSPQTALVRCISRLGGEFPMGD